ncbi:aminoglycoside phosphotransferase family protein [Micromonospora sp. LOL_023]|uniref:aminoglycoside phosphotransferase family protein n=1 Tax=Micromonospora sp. LOL_023 TaxID=3345418 RepID=UPI003A8B5D6A
MDEPHDSRRATNGITIPQSFLNMPRWWQEGAEWLAELPRAIRLQCEKWDLRIVGELSHGSHAVVVPVTRDGEEYALRIAPPDTDVADQVRALRFWDGRGTVLLIEADVDHGAMLLERLAMHLSLSDRPVDKAVAILGRMIRRLAVAAPPDVQSTATLARTIADDLEATWHRLHEPFDKAFLAEALDVAPGLSGTSSVLAVNGDLHSGQVLKGSREPWLTVDPLLLRGDIEYDLARVLWTRLDDMADAAEVVAHFETAVAEGGLDYARARDWVVFRSVEYWLWGLNAGLTEDPQRCRRLVSVFMT